MNNFYKIEMTKQEQFQHHIQSILENVLIKDDLWKIDKVDFDKNRSEIHAYIYANVKRFVPCSHCNQIHSPTITQSNKIRTYLSICGMRTYIHADDIQINCLEHGIQFITPPWDQHITELLNLKTI